MHDEGLTFDWDDENRNHLARHEITPLEAEEVVQISPLDIEPANGGWEEWRRTASSGRRNREGKNFATPYNIARRQSKSHYPGGMHPSESSCTTLPK
jgi:hypothetical protein